MSRKRELGFPRVERTLESFEHAMERSAGNYYLGVTQGGSSRKYRGAKPAAKATGESSGQTAAERKN